MGRSSSLNNSTTTAITRLIGSKYDLVKIVADNITSIESVASQDVQALTTALNDAKDFTGITVVPVSLGTPSSWDATTKTLYVETVQGKDGEQGLQGPAGIKGDTGERGSIGPQGPQGEKGDTGLKGDKGDKGDRGLQGISVHHTKGTSTTNPNGVFGAVDFRDTYTLYGDADETIVLGSFVVQNAILDPAVPYGPMYKSIYDIDNDGIVDDSTRLGGKTLAQVESERTAEIRAASLALGSNYTVSNITERDALVDLTVGDVVHVADDGDGKWAEYYVTAVSDGLGSTSTFTVIMDADTYLNANTKEAIKSTYESNPDTNPYTDADKTFVDITTPLTTLATTLPTGINELKTRVDNINTAIGVSNDTYTASNTANYITLATSLFDADVKLDSQIKVNEDAIVQARIDIDGNALAYSIALG